MPTPAEEPRRLDDDDDEAMLTRARNAVAELRRSMGALTGSAEERGRGVLQALDDELHRWTALLEERRDMAADEAKLHAHLAVMEVSERAKSLDDVFKNAMGAVRHQMSSSAAKVDHARVQAHLARLDAEDAARERTARFRKRLASAKRTAEHPVRAAEDQLADLIRSWAGLYH